MYASRTAIVAIELQNDFLSDAGKLHSLLKEGLEQRNVVDNVINLISHARSLGMSIVHVPIQFSKDYRDMGHAPYGIMKIVKDSGALIKGSWGTEIPPAIKLSSHDIIVDGKSSIHAFAGTNLDYILRARGTSTIALIGQLTNICIESTMRSAYDKGYKVFGLTDATATIGHEQYHFSVQHTWPMFSVQTTCQQFLEETSRVNLDGPDSTPSRGFPR